MVGRPTIADLAAAADVSTSTINRILHGTGPVRQATIRRVQDAAEEIGFYGLGVIEARHKDSVPSVRLGFLLQQSHRELYRMFGENISRAANDREDFAITALIDYVDRLSPETISDRLLALGREVDAVAVVAEDHPLIGQAIEKLCKQNTPVVAYITDQSAPSRAGYVGTDNWKLGRTAAWFIAQTSRFDGKVAVFIGNHRYQCQDMSDAGFRSYMREYAPNLKVSDSIPTHEEPENAYCMVREMLQSEEELVGIYMAGGGISGVLRALRELEPGSRPLPRLVCRDIGPETRKGLTEGLITAALSHPLQRTSAELIDKMLLSLEPRDGNAILQRILPFEIAIPESM